MTEVTPPQGRRIFRRTPSQHRWRPIGGPPGGSDPAAAASAAPRERPGRFKTALLKALAGILALLPLPPGLAAPPQKARPDLTSLSIEDLLNVQVTSVSRRQQKLSQSASAIYVITQEDIRRSGVTTIPDALRLAPGVQVMQMDGTKWAVSIRGFNGRFSNKLLVMIDGRSIYNPIFAGVYWEANDVLLDDVERIEVIRGPGATVWGTNAVNGVINIITKNSRETQGLRVSGGGGNQEGALGSARFGGEAGPRLHYRFYSKYNSRSGLLLASGARANDNTRKTQGGFRVDWQASERDELLFSGDTYEGDGGERYRVVFPYPPFPQVVSNRATFSGANLVSRWTHKHSEGSNTQLQIYFDRVSRDNLLERDTGYSVGDAELQHEKDFSRHRLVAGVGYRVSKDETGSDWFARFEPPSRTLQRINVFAQDEIAVVPDRLLLTVGSKFENNTFTNWEIQPSVSLLWNVTATNTTWLSYSHADKSPARPQRDLVANAAVVPGPQGSLIVTKVLGSPETVSEELRAFEAGYRLSPRPRLSFDIAAFFHVYEDLITPLPGPPFFAGGDPPTTVIPLTFTNLDGKVKTHGAELAASWSPLEAATLRVSYSLFRGGLDTTDSVRGPGHQLQARWYWNLPGRFEWDSSYFFTDGFSTIPAYHRVDTRLGWRPSPRYEFSIVGQHLLDNQHLESPALFAIPSEIGRGVYGKLTLSF